MKKRIYSKAEIKFIEKSPIPIIIFRRVDAKITVFAVSDGFVETFEFLDRDEVFKILDSDFYNGIHPDDVATVKASFSYFVNDVRDFDESYRVRVRGPFHIVHAFASKFSIEAEKDEFIEIWYTYEGVCESDFLFDAATNMRNYNMKVEIRSIENKLAVDELTGLPTLSRFFKLAEDGRIRMKEQGKDPALVFFNLNDMKSYNMKYGMGEGDRLLREVAGLLAKHFCSENCSRIANDNFAAFTDAASVEKELESFFEDCRHIMNGNTLPIRAGVYLDSLGEVCVSTACDLAKLASDDDRNVYISHFNYFDKAMLDSFNKRQYIIDNIDNAIKEDWIKVYYQPIIRTANGRVCDEEALARWEDPQNGFMSPADFVPILESTKLIYKLDLYIVEKILEKIKEQQSLGIFVVPISVNLSRSDFEVCDIVEEVRKRVDESGVGRDKLTIEITESIVGKNLKFMKNQIARFKSLGFSVWMDDYGSGYSSPELLEQISFDLLKFDMLFVKNSQASEKSRIILTEQIKMAVALGIETVAEGVESDAQADFLTEVGCTKLQGYKYCRPITKEQIFERYKSGKQIGFENPEETEYYKSLGRINLYDAAISIESDCDDLTSYFNTMPMAILEISGDNLHIVRGNKTFREFSEQHYPLIRTRKDFRYEDFPTTLEKSIFNKTVHCAQTGQQQMISEYTPGGFSFQIMLRRVSVNPLKKISAVSLVLLSFSKKDFIKEGLDYNYIAKALSADYISLYYFNKATGYFIEYVSECRSENMVVEQYGDDFFTNIRAKALKKLYKPDQKEFLERFTMDNISSEIAQCGTFSLTYRRLFNGEPIYVSMKIAKLAADSNQFIIGISNVDAQVKFDKMIDRVRDEHLAYKRISALSGDYICIYLIDPNNGHFTEFASNPDFAKLGLNTVGYDFFTISRKESYRCICKDDVAYFLENFTPDNIIDTIRRKGLFELKYRLLLNEQPTYVRMRAALINEDDKTQMILGLVNIDAQIKRDREYAHNLSVAQNRANIDVLTGTGNKYAYTDMEKRIDHLIEIGKAPEFAIVVCDLNDLKNINDSKGHLAGDEYIVGGYEMICEVFMHSPVFRIGGDEFAIVVQGGDYGVVESLMKDMQKKNESNRSAGGVVVASGMSKFDADRCVADVFDRADKEMYKNKSALKK